MTPSTARLVRVIAAVLLAGCVVPQEELGTTSAPIVGGTLGGDSAVVVLQNYRSGGLCSGALIGERVVLTAKHCVQEAFASGTVSPSDIVVGVGDNIRSLSAALRVQSITTTPGSYSIDSRGSVGNDLIGVDVAVMVLQSGMPGVTPIPVMRESPAALSGQIITAIGFGQTPSGQVGVKYTTTGRVQSVSGDLIYVGPITCQGDSGGPAVTSAREVAGVVSFGAGSCGSGYGAYNAVHSYLDMIDEALTAAGSCLNDGEERCDGADNDCNGLVDETCTAIGGACSLDSECVGLTCRDTVGGRLCTTPCDPLRPEFGCGPDFYCARDEGCQGYCVPLSEARTALANEAPCTRDEECASLFCNNPGDGRRRCLTPCRGEDGMCLAGEACAALPGACGACVAEAILDADRGMGEGCEATEECRSGLCYEDAGRSYCSRTCAADSECPSGYHCRGDPIFTCAAGPRGDIGDPCVGNGDCAALTFCAARAEQSWCTRMCTETEPCPVGFSCVAAGAARVCAPDRGLVGDACAADDECISGTCAIGAGASEAACTRLCGPDAPCATGLECRRTEDGVTAVCLTPAVEVSGGGCAVSRAGSGVHWLWAVAAIAGLWLVRRRRVR